MAACRNPWVLIIAVSLASCSAPPKGRGTTFADSAGITVAVAESPSWRPGRAWHVSRTPILQIGAFEGPDEIQFTEVIGAVRLGDGRIVVGDRGASELRVFGSEGAFLRRVGRQGEGPGEFRRLDFLGIFGGDSLVTFDSALRRVQIFGSEGGLARSYEVESPVETAIPDKVVDVASESGLVIRFIDFGSEIPDGIVRWPHELLVIMDLRTGGLDSIAYLPGAEAVVEARPNGGYSHGQYIFGKGYEYSAEANRIAYISTDTFAVHVLEGNGRPLLEIRRKAEPKPATEEDLERYLEGVLALVFPEESDPAPEDVQRFRESRLKTPRASTLPILRSVKLDAEGNLWVEPYFHPGEDPPPYLVFRADGTWLGEVAMPPGFNRGFISYQAPGFQIGSDFILGVWQDELDVQYVRLYGLTKDS